LLLGTLGGFGAVFSFLGLAWVRALSRIGVFIAFLAFFMLALGVDRLVGGGRPIWKNHLMGVGVSGGLILFGLWDQTCADWPSVSYEEERRAAYQNDATFVRQIEARIPDRAMIFQLPHVPFYEAGIRHGMKDYTHLRGYLHSNRLRWSYGGLDGQEGEAWARQVAAAPPLELVQQLCYAGFTGIYVDWNGYGEDRNALEVGLGQVLEVEPIRSSDQRFAFYPLLPYQQFMAQSLPHSQWQTKAQAVLDTVRLTFGKGFSREQVGQHRLTRLGEKDGEFWLVNPGQQDQEVSLTLSVRTTMDETADMCLTSAIFAEEFPVNGQDRTLTRTLAVPPGRHRVGLTMISHDPPYSRKTRWRLTWQVSLQPGGGPHPEP